MNNLIEKTFTYRGESRTVFFRELTAGEQLKLSQGYKSTLRDGATETTLDFHTEGERAHRLLQMTLVDANGRNVYTNIGKLQEEPVSKINKLVELAREASRQFTEEGAEAGND